MLSFNGGLKVYVALDPCDMRKSFHGLTAMVRNHLELDPLSGAAYLFTNKTRNLIKILYFDSTGYWVVAKKSNAGASAGLGISRAAAARSCSNPPCWPCSPMALI